MKNFKISCLLAAVLLGLVFLSSAFAEETQFSDVPVSHWAYSAIGNLTKAQIVKGYPDQTFKPGLPVTREQFAAVLTLTLKLPTDNKAPETFSDVPRNHWAFLYIDATKAFIPTPSNPMGSFNFNGGKPITREEVGVSLALALDLQENANVNSSYLPNTFKDYKKISLEYRPQVALVVYNQVMSGNPDGTFNGKGPLTRAELCALMNKLLNEIEAKKPKPKPDPEKPGIPAKPHQPWTIEYQFKQPDIDLVKTFVGVVSSKVYGPVDYYLVLDHNLLSGGRFISKSVNMYVYEKDLQWFFVGDMISVEYDRKNNIVSYRFEQQAQPHPYLPPVNGKK